MASWPLFIGVVREVLFVVGLTVKMAACQLRLSSVDIPIEFKENVLGEVLRHPIGILLLQLRHNYDFIAGLDRIVHHSAIPRGISPRVANVRGYIILIPQVL